MKKILNYFKNISNFEKEEQKKALINSFNIFEDKYFSKQKNHIF